MGYYNVLLQLQYAEGHDLKYQARKHCGLNGMPPDVVFLSAPTRGYLLKSFRTHFFHKNKMENEKCFFTISSR